MDGSRSNEDRRVVANRRSAIAVSTTISKEQSDDWAVFCEIIGKSSYVVLRMCIEGTIQENRALIDKRKQQKVMVS